MALTRQQILDAQDLKNEEVVIPEWGSEPVKIRELSGIEFEKYLNHVHKSGGDDTISGSSSLLVALSVVDDTGALQFSETDVQPLSTKNAMALQKLCKAILRLNRMDGEAEKNSDPGQTG
ncbi:MAG: hypothetical protein HQL95_01720 [Magnetococcales bacterium]|nr:hypothetical protein [Magnetococcales bacterium]